METVHHLRAKEVGELVEGALGEPRARDDNNKGTLRKEMICFIAELENMRMKTAENHYDHLIRSKQLS